MSTTHAADFYPTTIPGDLDPDRRSRLVIVHEPDGETTRVQWRLGHTDAIWKCGDCGPMQRTECVHTFSAGIRLAQELLGLTPTITAHEHINNDR